METLALSQVLHILPFPAFHVRVEGDVLIIIDANLSCRMLWPQIPSSGMPWSGDVPSSNAEKELLRIARGGGVSHLEFCLSVDSQYVMHIAHCGTDSAIVIIQDRKRPDTSVGDMSLLQRVMEDVSDWILWVGRDNELVYTSPSVLQTTGYTAEELMGGDSLLERLIHEADRSLFFHHKQETIEHHAPSQLQFRIRRRDGTVRWIMHRCKPVFEKDGTFRGIVSSNHDITEQKRSEHFLRLMQFSMEHAQEAVFWLRRDASFFYVNDAACRMLGYSQGELLGMKAGDLNPAHSGDIWEQYWHSLREKSAVQFEALFVHADGSRVPVEISANFLWFEDREFNCSFVRNITERKQNERDLVEHREKLSQAMRFGKMGSFEYDVESGILMITEENTFLLDFGVHEHRLDGEDLLNHMLEPLQAMRFRVAVSALVNKQDAGIEKTILLSIRDEAGDLRWLNTRLRLRPQNIPRSHVVIGVTQDVTELRSSEAAIRAMLHASSAIGERFFSSLAKELCATLDVRYAFVAEMLPSSSPSARTIALCSRKQRVDDIQFDLHDTPFEALLSATIVLCLSDLQVRFPKDASLKGFGVDSCVGIRLDDQDGNPIGILGVMDTRPMRDSELSIQILKVMAGRAAAELLRIRSERTSDELSRQFQQVFHSSVDGMCITDDERPLLVNASALRMFGYESAETIRKMTIFDFFHPDEHGRIREYRSRDAEGRRKVEFYETIGMRSDGSTFDVEIRVSEYEFGGTSYSFIILRDISERKRHQAELIAAKERAEQSERLKDAFVATVSHEIRTPLNIISGYTELLREVFTPYTDQETSEYFDSVHAGVRRLERTVDLILNISRIQSGDTRLNPVMIDLRQFLRTRVEDFRHIIEANGVELRYEVDQDVPKILLDEYCMSQALDNLLDNANKFTQQGRIAVRLHGPANGQITIEIEDTGIGISAEYLPRLFDRYSQEEVGYGRKYEGLGLGLTLVREYLRLNGGSISVRSVKGQGTTFTIQLPLSIS